MARVCDVTGKKVMVGNNVSHANNRTKRRFLPNLQKASFLSDALNEKITLKVSTNGIRTIEHKGGIDAFLAQARANTLAPNVQKIKKRIEKAMASA